MAFFRLTLLFFAFLFLSACGGGGGNASPASAASSTPNTDLIIRGTPVLKAEEDAAYSFSVNVGNASGNVEFQIENGPAWMTAVNSGNVSANVSGTPKTDADAGIFENITISATDGRRRKASLAPFNLEVIAVNDPPFITFQQTALILDARESFVLSYTITDEEGDRVELELAGMADDLNATVSGSAITGTARDVNEVRSGVLGVALISNGDTVDTSIDAKIFPKTANGEGRTIFGRKSGAGVNLVILGDGYTAEQSDLYRADAEDFIREMHLDSGIESHMPAWNIHVVDKPSNQSGADDDYGTDTVDTYFGSGFNCADIQRLICANRSLVWTTALNT